MAKQKPTLRLGFIGAGGIADLQFKSLAHRDDVEIIAIADVSPQVIDRRAQAMPAVSMFSDYKEMLRTQNLDAVSVCTPNIHHARPTIDALRAGCHVLCEKPLAMNVAEARRMVATAKKAKRKLVTGFQYRFDPRTQFIKQAFDDGQLGKVLYGRVQAMRRRGIPNWGVFGQKALQGGGPLIDIGVHVLEMAHYAMGSPQPISASADMFTYLGDQPNGDQPNGDIASMWPNWDHKTYTVEDLAVGRIRFATGAVLNIESAFAAHIPEGSLMNFQLMGDKGGAIWEKPTLHTDESGHMVDKQPAWLAETAFDKVFARKMHAFVDHVLHGKPTIASGQAGLTVQAMLNALYRSAENSGRETKITL